MQQRRCTCRGLLGLFLMFTDRQWPPLTFAVVQTNHGRRGMSGLRGRLQVPTGPVQVQPGGVHREEGLWQGELRVSGDSASEGCRSIVPAGLQSS